MDCDWDVTCTIGRTNNVVEGLWSWVLAEIPSTVRSNGGLFLQFVGQKLFLYFHSSMKAVAFGPLRPTDDNYALLWLMSQVNKASCKKLQIDISRWVPYSFLFHRSTGLLIPVDETVLRKTRIGGCGETYAIIHKLFYVMEYFHGCNATMPRSHYHCSCTCDDALSGSICVHKLLAWNRWCSENIILGLDSFACAKRLKRLSEKSSRRKANEIFLDWESLISGERALDFDRLESNLTDLLTRQKTAFIDNADPTGAQHQQRLERAAALLNDYLAISAEGEEPLLPTAQEFLNLKAATCECFRRVEFHFPESV